MYIERVFKLELKQHHVESSNYFFSSFEQNKCQEITPGMKIVYTPYFAGAYNYESQAVYFPMNQVIQQQILIRFEQNQ